MPARPGAVNRKAEHLLAALDRLPKGAVVVEIGCARFAAETPSDGWSTVHLARTASERGWSFHSVDCDARAVLTAASLIAGLPGTIHHSDGAAWLQEGPEIDGLYLDGSSSPQEALTQYHAARLTEHAVVAVDDIQPIGEAKHGKGDLLLTQLPHDGFEVTISDTEPGYRMAVATR